MHKAGLVDEFVVAHLLPLDYIYGVEPGREYEHCETS